MCLVTFHILSLDYYWNWSLINHHSDSFTSHHVQYKWRKPCDRCFSCRLSQSTKWNSNCTCVNRWVINSCHRWLLMALRHAENPAQLLGSSGRCLARFPGSLKERAKRMQRTRGHVGGGCSCSNPRKRVRFEDSKIWLMLIVDTFFFFCRFFFSGCYGCMCIVSLLLTHEFTQNLSISQTFKADSPEKIGPLIRGKKTEYHLRSLCWGLRLFLGWEATSEEKTPCIVNSTKQLIPYCWRNFLFNNFLSEETLV